MLACHSILFKADVKVLSLNPVSFQHLTADSPPRAVLRDMASLAAYPPPLSEAAQSPRTGAQMLQSSRLLISLLCGVLQLFISFPVHKF